MTITHNFYTIYPDEAANARELLKRYKRLQLQHKVLSRKLPGYTNANLHNEMCHHHSEVGRQIEHVIGWLQDFLRAAKVKDEIS